MEENPNQVEIVIDSFRQGGKVFLKNDTKYIKVRVPGIADREQVKAWLIKMLPRLVEALKREGQRAEDKKHGTQPPD